MKAHKIGAVFYILWGLLHIAGGLAIIFQVNSALQIAVQATALPAGDFQHLSNAALSGILSYHGFNIVWFGIFAATVAILFNWKNRRIGYWLNLLVIGAVEIGLVFFMLVPGYMAWSDGGIGLALFLVAVVGTTLGLTRDE